MGGFSDAVSYDDGSTDEEAVEEVPVRREPPAPSERVREIVRRAQSQRSQQNGETEDGFNADAEELTPGSRMESVRTRAPEYEREYRLKLLHRLLMRKIPLDEIANTLEVSVSTVQRDRRELLRRLRDEASRLDINALLGDTMAFYNETGAMAMRIATNIKSATPHRLAALRTAMTSRKELGQWFAAAGVFEQLKFVPQDEAQSGDLARLISISEKLLLDEDDTIEDLGDLDGMGDMFDDENVSLIL